MGLHGGRWIWKHPTTTAVYVEEIHDTTPSKIAAANARAASALSAAGILKDTHGRGNSVANSSDYGDMETNSLTNALVS